MILTKTFHHYDLWVRYQWNKANTINMLNKFNSLPLLRTATLLEQIHSSNVVPSHLFKEGVKRASGLKVKEFEDNLISVKQPTNRFKKVVDEGLQIHENTNKTRHYSVLSLILERDVNSLAVEVPLWCMFYPDGPYWTTVVGHIDLLQFFDDKIWIWDFKPDDDPHVRVQLAVYKEMLLRLILDLRPEDIELGWFDKTDEFKVQNSRTIEV